MSSPTQSFRQIATTLALVVGGVLVHGHCGVAADSEASAPLGQEDINQVLATVDGVPIQLGEVRQELQAALSNRQPDAADDSRLVQKMLQQIVQRRLALAGLISVRRGANDQLVERAVAAHRAGFEQRGESLDDFLRQNGVPIESFQQRLRWDLSWAAYKEAMLTDENLQRFFERYRRHFDGTEVRASHILVRNKEQGTGDSGQGTGDESVSSTEFEVESDETIPSASALDRAREIREAINAGELTFAEAAAKYSDAPSKDRGGDIGFFPRRGVMHEAFAAAAFGLEPDEISSPVVTSFGVHLIRILDEKPGNMTLADVREEVYRAAEARLFDTLVDSGRKRAKIEYASP